MSSSVRPERQAHKADDANCEHDAHTQADGEGRTGCLGHEILLSGYAMAIGRRGVVPKRHGEGWTSLRRWRRRCKSWLRQGQRRLRLHRWRSEWLSLCCDCSLERLDDLGGRLRLRQRTDHAVVVQQEIDDLTNVAGAIAAEAPLHEARSEQEFAWRAKRSGRGQAFRCAGRKNEMRKPGIVFRREAEARFRRAADGAAYEKPVEPVALAVGAGAIAREGEEHGEHDEALLSVQYGVDARFWRRDSYDPEMERLFGHFFLVEGVAHCVFEVDDELGQLGRTPDKARSCKSTTVSRAT